MNSEIISSFDKKNNKITVWCRSVDAYTKREKKEA